PTLYDRRTRAGVLALEQLRDEHASVAWPEPVPIDTRLRDAARAGLPAPVHSPDSRAVAVYRRIVDRLTGAPGGAAAEPGDARAGRAHLSGTRALDAAVAAAGAAS